jgi:hypothetical protein
MLIPKFDDVWHGFPDHEVYPSMGALYRAMGGSAQDAIGWDGFGEHGNTCASRVSIALNRSGSPIAPAVTARLNIDTLKTAEGQRIIFRVRELRHYLLEAYGAPDIDETPPFGDQYAGSCGIVAFSVRGWSDATGHMALFDGSTYREADHDDVPTVYPEVTVLRTEFWKLR